jgi:hypothetical protein
VVKRVPACLGALLCMMACGGRGQTSPAVAKRPAAASPVVEALTSLDVRTLVAVRTKALQRLEDALEKLSGDQAGAVAQLGELSSAERDAAAALGMDWSRYRWARARANQVMTAQRQAEDRRLLVGELSRVRDDLLSQMATTTDGASREFLQAQLASVETQLARLKEDQKLPPGLAREAELLATARVDLAMLAGREERLQERLRQALRRAGAATGDGAGRPTGAPGST